jgi:pSer/pThr/pTyr-binding forkhead associated (FHA) protein
VITLNLLHPNQSIPVQNWTFPTETKIRIGRAIDNEVVLYSAVVSRYHVELRRNGNQWEVINLGANGTFIGDKSIEQTPASDGMIVRLASSGPKIQLHIPSEESPLRQKLAQINQSLTVPEIPST